jgi:hypothetical protein
MQIRQPQRVSAFCLPKTRKIASVLFVDLEGGQELVSDFDPNLPVVGQTPSELKSGLAVAPCFAGSTQRSGEIPRPWQVITCMTARIDTDKSA